MNIKLQIYTKSVCDPMKEVLQGLLSSRADATKIEHSRLFTKMHSLYRRSKLLAKFGYYPWHKHFIKLNSNKISNREGTLLKTGKFKGCVTTKILIVGPTWPVASIFKPNSIKGVAFGITKLFWDCGIANWAADLQLSKSIFLKLFGF